MDKKQILATKKLFLFDMDGTLYLGDRLFDFTKPLLHEIRRTGGKYLFMTNNSSKSVADYVKKLEKLGICATREDFKLVKNLGIRETGILVSCSDYHIFKKMQMTRKQCMEYYLKTVADAFEAGVMPRCHLEDITRADFYATFPSPMRWQVRFRSCTTQVLPMSCFPCCCL